MLQFFYRQRLFAAVCANLYGVDGRFFYAANAFAEALRPCGDLVAWLSVVSALIFVAERG